MKLRGAGLTYGFQLSNDAESRVLSFSLYRCGDALSAYKAAKQIIADYASGALAISAVQLAGAKSSLAYSIISRTATKSSAFSSAWTSSYIGTPIDHGRWLLAQVDGVGVIDAMHALKKYLVPLFFDPASNLFVTCPPSKAEALAEGFDAEHGSACTIVPEDRLNATFSGQESAPPPDTKGRAALAPKFTFAKGWGKCECPKCVPLDPAKTF